MSISACLQRQILVLHVVEGRLSEVVAAIGARRLQETCPRQLDFLQGVEERIVHLSSHVSGLLDTYEDLQPSQIESHLDFFLQALQSIELDFRNNPVFTNVI